LKLDLYIYIFKFKKFIDMEKYKIGKVLGDGTFGSVSKAVD
jgi:hypothetical protein